ncbi:olfactory receptor 1496-like [Anomaloglossus baeobatrachus]|uniref:olfactory receptor 1496-like n=1 Tax=Anomaloglossus baeobatrachus TaxID=238106 RepID=UPI003F506A78
MDILNVLGNIQYYLFRFSYCFDTLIRKAFLWNGIDFQNKNHVILGLEFKTKNFSDIAKLDMSMYNCNPSSAIFKLKIVFHVEIFHLFSLKENNQTVVTEFFLIGFQVDQELRILLFSLFLVVYCLIIYGNILIIILVSTSKNLHTPMYFFISQLSISDILLTADIIPNMLHILLNNGGIITFTGCITQLYFFCGSEAAECFLLTAMSYDRYVAICNPLHYPAIMTSEHCETLIAFCWLFGLSFILVDSISTAKLHFCGLNIIDHFFCDLVPLLGLACSDTFIVDLEICLLSIPIIIIPATIIVMSYTYIVSAVLRIPSSTRRQKAFSTCSSHLTVVSIFYWTMFSVYIFPTKGRTVTISKVLSLLYTVFTPFANPIIYSLKNEHIKKAIRRQFRSM